MFSDPAVQHMFPLQATYYRQPSSLQTNVWVWPALPSSEYYELIRTQQ
jgi:hypothetical protein